MILVSVFKSSLASIDIDLINFSQVLEETFCFYDLTFVRVVWSKGSDIMSRILIPKNKTTMTLIQIHNIVLYRFVRLLVFVRNFIEIRFDV